MDDLGGLSDLYQQVILDHGRKPRNFHEMEGAHGTAEGYNPLCGDHVKVYVKLAGDELTDVAFSGKGCAICTASASIMTQTLKGRPRQHAEALFRKFHHAVTDEEDGGEQEGDDVELGKLEALTGVRNYPVRIKCATLPWHTVKAAIENRGETVTTE